MVIVGGRMVVQGLAHRSGCSRRQSPRVEELGRAARAWTVLSAWCWMPIDRRGTSTDILCGYVWIWGGCFCVEGGCPSMHSLTFARALRG